MGVPKFFRWVAERYPMVITPFRDSPPPVDNLYLDMNGIIHQCTHPNDIDASRKAPSEKEMVQAMFAYLEKLFTAIQPKKYFVMAVDGVAPRAKMNQQRQRRYRAGYEMMLAREEALLRGDDLPEEGDVFDSNCITPGTEFMVRIQEHFEYFIAMKLQTDSAWQNCKVIFSGQDHPGEGEHKIVEFIRKRKMQPDYSPNETHCMYGLDADLVMLALATHEPRFVLLREVVSFGTSQSRKERERKEEDERKGIKADSSFAHPDEFVLFHINVLREYLELEFRSKLEVLPVNFDFERVIDDFVFMCFFIGNDFLPSIPTIGINDGSMVTMLNIYRDTILARGAYLTRDSKPNWNSLEIFLTKIGELELDTLRSRQEEEAEHQKRQRHRNPDHEVKHSNVPVTSIVEYKEKFYREKHEFEEGWNARGDNMKKLTTHYVEGIMWNMEYYYNGPPSWKWYFPHHYAPLASDLVNLSAVASRVRFDRGKPFLPHQQLLAVLPPMSFRSMPDAYWPLLKSNNSPLKKYFPDKLLIDKEGARNPWEGIVLIPFMDEKVLVAAYESVQSRVKPEDAKKNELRIPVKFERDPSIKPYTLASAMFGPLRNLIVDRCPYEFPEAATFVAKLCPNVRIREKEIEGFSSLHSKTALIRPSYEIGAVSIFGAQTKRESLILNLEDEHAPTTAEEAYHLINQEVLVGFPHYKRARVAMVIDRKKKLVARWDDHGHFGGVVSEDHTAEEAMSFRKEAETHQNFLKAKVGIALPEVNVLVYVHRMVGMKITKKGRVVRQFAKSETCYPYQLMVRLDQMDLQCDPRYIERDREEIDCSGGAQVIYAGPEPLNAKDPEMSVFGAKGYVMEIDDKKEYYTVSLRLNLKRQSLPASLVRFASANSWITLKEAADRVRISALALTMLCSSLVTSAQYGSQELGLCLKFTGKNLARVGYTKLVQTQANPWYVGASNIFQKMEDDTDVMGHHLQHANVKKGDFLGRSSANQSGKGTWYFSEAAVELIQDYVRRFQPLVRRLETGGANSNSLEPQEFMTGPWKDRKPEDILNEITEYLEKTGVAQKPMIPASEDSFTVDHLRELEAHLEASPPRETKDQMMRRILKQHLYFPNVRTTDGFTMAVPLPKEQKYQVGSRIVNCRTTGAVPFGAFGTITRLVSGQSAEVVMDEPFTGGNRLNGRLKTNRGALVKLGALLVTNEMGTASHSATTAASAVKTFVAKPATLGELQELTGVTSSPPSITAQLSIPKPKSAIAATAAEAASGVDLAAFTAKLRSEATVHAKSEGAGGVNLAELAKKLPGAVTPPSGVSPPSETAAQFPIDPAAAGNNEKKNSASPSSATESMVPKPRSAKDTTHLHHQQQQQAKGPAAVAPVDIPAAPVGLMMGAPKPTSASASNNYRVVGPLGSKGQVQDIFTTMLKDKLAQKFASLGINPTGASSPISPLPAAASPTPAPHATQKKGNHHTRRRNN